MTRRKSRSELLKQAARAKKRRSHIEREQVAKDVAANRRAARIRRVSASSEAKSAARALFDPRRDAPPAWRDLTAMLMGDPPIGRSALDQREAASCRS